MHFLSHVRASVFGQFFFGKSALFEMFSNVFFVLAYVQAIRKTTEASVISFLFLQHTGALQHVVMWFLAFEGGLSP